MVSLPPFRTRKIILEVGRTQNQDRGLEGGEAAPVTNTKGLTPTGSTGIIKVFLRSITNIRGETPTDTKTKEKTSTTTSTVVKEIIETTAETLVRATRDRSIRRIAGMTVEKEDIKHHTGEIIGRATMKTEEAEEIIEEMSLKKDTTISIEVVRITIGKEVLVTSKA